MPKVFYKGGGTHKRGILRVVIPLNQLQSVFTRESSTYLGLDFPEFPENSGPIILVEISSYEATDTWPQGFFRLEASQTDFEEGLRSLPQTNHRSSRAVF